MTVDQAGSVEEAIAAARTTPYHLLLTSTELPDVADDELPSRLRHAVDQRLPGLAATTRREQHPHGHASEGAHNQTGEKRAAPPAHGAPSGPSTASCLSPRTRARAKRLEAGNPKAAAKTAALCLWMPGHGGFVHRRPHLIRIGWLVLSLSPPRKAVPGRTARRGEAAAPLLLRSAFPSRRVDG
jgi:hypothetical protein